MNKIILASLAALALLFAGNALVAAQGCGTGNPNCIAPTPPPGDDSNRIATTAFVANQGVAFSALPTPGSVGQIKYITDGKASNCGDGTCTTFGTAVTGGGGALRLLVWRNGTSWTLIGK